MWQFAEELFEQKFWNLKRKMLNTCAIITFLSLFLVNSVKSTNVAIPTKSQVWYQQAEIHALIHFNMATFFHNGDPGCYAYVIFKKLDFTLTSLK